MYYFIMSSKLPSTTYREQMWTCWELQCADKESSWKAIVELKAESLGKKVNIQNTTCCLVAFEYS